MPADCEGEMGDETDESDGDDEEKLDDAVIG